MMSSEICLHLNVYGPSLLGKRKPAIEGEIRQLVRADVLRTLLADDDSRKDSQKLIEDDNALKPPE
jgi:hypothetical protein